MDALGEAGFDQVLDGVGRHFNLTRVSCFYPSFVGVSHADFSHMHSDSDHEKIFNLIFPVRQVDSAESEINLGANEKYRKDPFNVPHHYEPDHGTLLGLDGLHGTAPTDYRGVTGPQKFLLVASVYFGAFDETFVDRHVEDWQDPPYPLRENLRDALMYRMHWSATDPTKKLGSPQVNDFASVRVAAAAEEALGEL